MSEEEPSVMFWEELSLTKRGINQIFFISHYLNHLTPENALPGNKDIVGNRD